MMKLKCLLMAWGYGLGLLLLNLQTSWAADEPVKYLLGPGDVLEISVWKDTALTKQVVVLPDGAISFPLVGEMVAAGKNVSQLKKELEEKIQEYVPSPVISVMVQQVSSMLIYVIGKVNNPGRFTMNANLTVLQALAMAGGLNPFAKESTIKIIREEQGNKQILNFDYNEIAKKNNLAQDIILKKGDVVLVP